MQATDRAYVLSDEEGEAIWFAGTLVVLKAAGDQTEGRLAFMDQRLPGNYAAPRHVHRDDDEGWYVLEGEATFFCGERRFTATAGAWVFLPRGVQHTFRTGPDGARLLTLSAPAGFADFVRAAGEPAPARTIPPPAPVDVETLSAIAAHHGIEIVGPPPSPEDAHR
jgi:mannose-6-phosphate isomerase-like protein (cupin superfamily)